ncbi:predicted protein [Chaetoceros tenuissimus]|uniref:Uncharacterized protein n=1 Tax=Chaetoceros tenuissimus TaxID=426638 RepID=A0AAD3D1E7_9STRA|nr:predicted protein [Chaetoceros tenuissimus]
MIACMSMIKLPSLSIPSISFESFTTDERSAFMKQWNDKSVAATRPSLFSSTFDEEDVPDNHSQLAKDAADILKTPRSGTNEKEFQPTIANIPPRHQTPKRRRSCEVSAKPVDSSPTNPYLTPNVQAMNQKCSSPKVLPSAPKKQREVISSLSSFEIQELAMPQLPIKSNDERDDEQVLQEHDQRLKSLYKKFAQRRNTRFENIREDDEEAFQTELSFVVSPVVRPRPIRIRHVEEGHELLFLPDLMQ